MSAEWTVNDGTLGLKRGTNFVVPSANDIFGSVLEERQVWPDVLPGQSGVLESLRFMRYPLLLRLVLAENDGGGSIQLQLVGSAAAQQIPLSKIPSHDHVLIGNVWYPIEPSSQREVRDTIDSVGAPLGIIHSLKHFLELRRIAMSGGIVTSALDENKILAPMQFCPPEVGNPSNVIATLYPYQRDGWRWLRFVVSEGLGGILADEMGLGKTLQIISLIADSGSTTATPALIVAPGSILENWCREFSKFAPSIKVLKHHGPLRTGRPSALLEFDVVVTSYDAVVRDGALFGMMEWSTVILDEAQNIRNPDAIRSRAAKSIRRKSSFAVTGTPVENKLTDLWSITDFVMPGYLGTLRDFQSFYPEDLQGASQVEKSVSPIMLRRKVSEVAKDLPERIDIPQAIELEPEEASAYEQKRADIFSQHGAAATLVSLTNLRMFCAHPSLVDDDWSPESSFSKLTRLNELIEEIFTAREKIIVFTSYTGMADIICSQIKNSHGVFARPFDGRTPIPDRQKLVDSFTSIIGPAALVLNPKAGGSGLNITAANHVIHYNLEWNPALEDQASARAYRRGQHLPVTVHRLFLVDTVEEVVDDRVARKRGVQDRAVVGISGQTDDYADIMSALQRSPVIPRTGG